MVKNKVWLWRAYDPVARLTLAWELGGRDDATCRLLLEKVGVGGNIFVTDDWEGFHRLIPEEQLFTGKDLTFPIEQDNSDVRHHLARFRRRSKRTSRARHMADGALRPPARWRRGRAGAPPPCGGPRPSCRCATASYLSSVKCLLACRACQPRSGG